MNIEQHLILLKGEDKTEQIQYCKYEDGKWNVTFNNNRSFGYSYHNVEWLRDPIEKDVATHVIYKKSQPLTGVSKILIFKSYCRVIYNNNYSEVYRLNEINIRESALTNQRATDCVDYFKTVADHISIKDELDSSFLRRQYERMTFINPNCVLAKYLDHDQHFNKSKITDVLFPFGFNISQKRATELALKNQLSVIEGPPGTGKTQTILNIIANAVINNKTVAVVSNNNSATANVIEKLAKYDLDFLCAYLGSNTNKEKFFSDQTGAYPDFTNWTKKSSRHEMKTLQYELNEMLKSKNVLAKVKQELKSLKTEFKYFEDYQKEIKGELQAKVSRRMNSDQILDLILTFKSFLNKNKSVNFITKLKMLFQYGFRDFKFLKQKPEQVITSLQKLYYEKRIDEKESKRNQLSKQLENYNFDHNMSRYTELSMTIFKQYLSKTFNAKERRIFDDTVLWKNSFDEFISEYPVILSTTHSLRNSVKQDYQFDYVIIDEASQVDLVSGGLALSCAKNAVIVGDTKQLPNVIQSNKIDMLNIIYSSFKLKEAYNVVQHSLLSSILGLYSDIPKTLLKEHYRCHPQIINFCNQKFYNNELIILTEDNEAFSPLSVYVTVEGNYARDMFNQRQIDVILEEVLPIQCKNEHSKTIGIISPYRQHADKIQDIITESHIDADTVHKFQGREKDIIILSTVANEINEFVDDPHLINVAVSRAVNHLSVVVANGFEKRKGTNIGDLIRYIKYNNFDVVESQVYSAFDLLYSDYSDKLLDKFKDVKKVSEYQSENLINSILENILGRNEFRSLGKLLHQPLRMLIKDTSQLGVDEYRYAMNILTHTDFLIYSKVDKSPILVIEVDGYAYHDQNQKQLKRDEMKDKILDKCSIPILRLKTNESGEESRVISKLSEILK